MNQTELNKYNHWNRVLWREYSHDWDSLFSEIKNECLKIKIACLIFWDSTEKKLAEGRDYNYLRILSDSYGAFVEDGYSKKELYNELIRIGYPDWLATKRSTPPKMDNK